MTVASADLDAVFAAERARLVGLAYRVLGSVADAEDVVQDVWLRLERTDQEIASLPAWLTTVTSRAAIDRLRARRRRERGYVGPWLPDPIVDDPSAVAELADSLTTGFLVLLERLSPVERVVLILADVFHEPFSAVAAVVGKTPAACRQIALRARRKVRAESAPPPVRAVNPAVAWSFIHAITTGDVDAVVGLLTDDAVAVSDGGAHAHAARRPVVGPRRVARLLVNLAKRLGPTDVVEPARINGWPGVVICRDGAPLLTVAIELDAAGAQVRRVYATVNPDKLTGARRPVHLT